MKVSKEQINEEIFHLIDRKAQYNVMTVLSKLTYRFNTIQIKISVIYFVDINKLKFIQ